MKVFLLYLVLGLGSLSLSGCSTTKDKGDDFMEAEDYSSAARMYENYLRSNPDDIEAKAGLKNARRKIIDQDLIQVRMSRLAGKSQKSLDLLLEIIKKEKAWNFSPGGPVAFTQGEEADFASDALFRMSSDWVQKGRPLRAQFLLKKYRPVVTEAKKPIFQKISDQVSEAGKNRCLTLQRHSDVKHPYYSDFLSSYCQTWGVRLEGQPSFEEEKKKYFYSQLDIRSELKNLPEELNGTWQALFLGSIKETPWFHPQGKNVMSIKIGGKYSYSFQKNPVSLVHEYSETESYVEMERVEKEREVPYFADETRYNMQTGQYYSKRVRKVRKEKYWTKEPVQKYRDVPRYFPYGAWKLSQKISFSGSGMWNLLGTHFLMQHQNQSKADGIEHEINMSRIGLKPSRANLPKKLSWTQKQMTELVSKYQTSLSKQWRDRYCEKGAIETDSIEVTGNQIQLCLIAFRKDEKEFPAHVDRWFQTHFDLNYREAQTVLL